MEDEQRLIFDFENEANYGGDNQPANDDGGAVAGGGGRGGGKRRRSTTVCRHYLRELCFKGDSCEFLHQMDESRMPICRYFQMYGECRRLGCVLKHVVTDPEDVNVKECFMYNDGFCPNGPHCQYRHRLKTSPVNVKELYEQIMKRAETYCPTATASKSPPQEHNSNDDQLTHYDHNNNDSNGSSSNNNNIVNANSGNDNRSCSPPAAAAVLPQGYSRYFILKSNNWENIRLSVQRGMWATQRKNEEKLNQAFGSCDNVILLFSVNRTSNFLGWAKMTSRIGEIVDGEHWNNADGTAFYGQNFCIEWLKLCELPFQKTNHLRNPYNDNLLVKISRDGQEVEPSVGEQLVSLLFDEQDNSELTSIAHAAERERERGDDEERSARVALIQQGWNFNSNPNICQIGMDPYVPSIYGQSIPTLYPDFGFASTSAPTGRHMRPVTYGGATGRPHYMGDPVGGRTSGRGGNGRGMNQRASGILPPSNTQINHDDTHNESRSKRRRDREDNRY